MDQLRKGIGLRGYAQQDPVIAYKQEGHEMFDEMTERIQTTTISRLLKGKIVRVPAQPARPQPAANRQAAPRPAQPSGQAPAQEGGATPSTPAQGSGSFVPEGTRIHRPNKDDKQ